MLRVTVSILSSVFWRMSHWSTSSASSSPAVIQSVINLPAQGNKSTKTKGQKTAEATFIDAGHLVLEVDQGGEVRDAVTGRDVQILNPESTNNGIRVSSDQ